MIYKMSSTINVFLDNSANSPTSNPPGYNLWVGGQQVHDPAGIKVAKTETNLPYSMSSGVSSLFTWYYNFGWYSGPNINGPFTDKQVIKLPAVTGDGKDTGIKLEDIEDIKEIIEDATVVVKTIEEKGEDIKEKVEDIVDNISEHVELIKKEGKEIKEKVEDIKEDIEELHEELHGICYPLLNKLKNCFSKKKEN